MARDTDVRHVLRSVQVPTLGVQLLGDQLTHVGNGRYLAEHIPGAKLVVVAGEDHFPWVGDTDAILDAVEHFVTGARARTEPNRVLATLLFADAGPERVLAALVSDRAPLGLALSDLRNTARTYAEVR